MQYTTKKNFSADFMLFFIFFIQLQELQLLIIRDIINKNIINFILIQLIQF